MTQPGQRDIYVLVVMCMCYCAHVVKDPEKEREAEVVLDCFESFNDVS